MQVTEKYNDSIQDQTEMESMLQRNMTELAMHQKELKSKTEECEEKTL